MPESYDITELKKKLEDITGKEVHLYDKDSLPYDAELDKVKLLDFMQRSFKLTLKTTAVKNVFKQYVKHLIKDLPYIKNQKQVDDLMIKYKKELDEYFEGMTIAKELTM